MRCLVDSVSSTGPNREIRAENSCEIGRASSMDFGGPWQADRVYAGSLQDDFLAEQKTFLSQRR